MRNIRLDLEYDGRNYFGWQCQPDRSTVEQTLKNAVEILVQHPVTIYSSGRTDSGVHAEQHVAHFFSETGLPHERILIALNSLLPDDIVPYRCVDMPQDWKARYDAVEREYRYTYYNDSLPSVFFRHWAYWIKKPLDFEAMKTAARYLEGRHDFSAFRSTHCDAENPVRTIYELSLKKKDKLIFMKVRGQAFLRSQVRTFAGTLLDIGLGRFDPHSIPDMLASKDRNVTGPSLPAHGLSLVAVRYEGDEERFAGQEHRSRWAHFFE
ncbi:MAG: tRNA pseudouridine(38-40) synthase TruA [Candidatus Omnitrophica bacterium]|nr:tRNA pseudouridine(38-40) synthase TruA [Candidatus Omnitrophota bacterium]